MAKRAPASAAVIGRRSRRAVCSVGVGKDMQPWCLAIRDAPTARRRPNKIKPVDRMKTPGQGPSGQGQKLRPGRAHKASATISDLRKRAPAEIEDRYRLPA